MTRFYKLVVLTMLFFICIALLATPAKGQESEWVLVSWTQDRSFVTDAKKGTFQYEALRFRSGDVPAIKGLFRVNNRGRINFYQYFVTLQDCADGWGKVHAYDMYGQFLFDNEFLFDGGTIASHNAKFICAVHESTQRNRNNYNPSTDPNQSYTPGRNF